MAPGMRSRSQVNFHSRRASQTFTSDDESSEEEEEEDSDDEGAGLSRKRTVTNRTYSGARSESGHGTRSQKSQPVRGKTKSELGHGSKVAGKFACFLVSLLHVRVSGFPSPERVYSSSCCALPAHTPIAVKRFSVRPD